MAAATPARARPWRPGRLPPIRRRWLVLLLLVILVLIGWILWTRYRESQVTRPNYQTVQVRQGTLQTTVAATGPIANPTSVPVSFKNAGKLVEVAVSIGDRVTEGQLLAQQDTTDLRTALNQAQAQLEQAQANEQAVRDGPTDETISQAEATFEQARVNRESAAKTLDATKEIASSAIASAVADVATANINLDAAQKSLASTIEQREVTIAASVQAVENAQLALENSRAAYDEAVTQAEVNLTAAQLDVDNAIRNLAAAKAGQAATEQVSEQSGVGTRVSVENARAALKDAQAQFEAQKTATEKDLVVQRRQRDQAEVSARSAVSARQEACSNSGTTASCNSAKRAENEAKASLRTAEAQLNQAEASARQTMTQAAGSVTTAQNAVRTAEASSNTGLANNLQSNTSARSSVESAANQLKTAMAAVASTKSQGAASVVQAKTAIDSAEATVRTATKSLESDRVQQNANVVQAQNAVEQARVALVKSQAALENTRASQANSVLSAENTLAQQDAALGAAQATYAVNTAPNTAAEVEQASAATEQQRQAVITARNNLEAATLRAPSDGTVASISGVVGQWVSGSGSSNTNGTSSSSTSAVAISSTGATNATGGFITLTDVGSLQVTPQVSEADVGRIAPGQNITFTVNAFPNQTFTGQVLSIQPVGQTVSNVVVYNVICVVDRTDTRLLPAMTATVNIIVEQQDNVILIPTSAIAYARTQAGGATARSSPTPVSSKPDQQADSSAGTSATVLVLRDGQAVPTRIRIGSSDDQNTVVLSGLDVGQLVITGQSTAAPASSGSSLFPGPGGRGGGGNAPKPGGP
ncbi:MAG: biotin/lipoyl-binding protein [Chloroflexota bacterium]